MQDTEANDLESQVQSPQSKTRNPTRYSVRIASAVWAVLILLGSILPGLPGLPAIHLPGADKVAHALAYGVLCLLVYLALGPQSLRRRVVQGAACALAYGAAMELIQLGLGWRTASLIDLLADLIGIVTMATGILLVCGRVREGP